MRQPVNFGRGQRGKSSATSLMSKDGINLKTLSQLLDTNFALRILNLLIDDEGKMYKRGGLEEKAEMTVSTDFTLNEQYYGDIKIIGYDTTISTLDTSTGTETVIKSDFSGSAPVSGTNYGDYFIVGTGGDYVERIGRVTIKLAYDNVVNQFRSGFTVTGSTSGATATVFEVDESNGVLTLGNVTGTFENNETITDNSTDSDTVIKIDTITQAFSEFPLVNIVTGAVSGLSQRAFYYSVDADYPAKGYLTFQGTHPNYTDNEALTGDIDGIAVADMAIGSATVDGVIYHEYEEISSAPFAKYVYAFLSSSGSTVGTRLYGFNHKEDRSRMQSSDVDAGTNPPFDTWTTGSSTANSGFLYTNKNHGEGNTIGNIGDTIVLGYENGSAYVGIDIIDSGGVLTKVTPTLDDNSDSGMARGAISTKVGFFYGQPKVGLFRQTEVGVPPVEISESLGRDYFADTNFDDLTITYDTKRRLILFYFGKGSSTNNIGFAYNLQTGSLVELSMNLSRVTKKNDVLFGTSSVDGKYFELFKGNTDDGENIPTEYKQELNFGSLDSLKDLYGVVLQARLGQGDEHTLDFDVYGRDGVFVENAIAQRVIMGTAPTEVMMSWGSASYGYSGWSSSSSENGLTSLPYETTDTFIPEFWRLIITLSSNDQIPFSYNFLTVKVVDRGESLLLNNITTN